MTLQKNDSDKTLHQECKTKRMSLAKIQTKYKNTGRGAKYGNGKLGGYPGLASTAHQIAEYIPKCKIFVEPFAGLGRIAKHVTADKKILNDMSDIAQNHLKKFNAIITKEDFIECIKRWDSEDTFFFIDPPWRKTMYEEGFCDRPPIQYYSDLIEILPKIKGKWIVASEWKSKERGKVLEQTGWNTILITSRKLILGNAAKTRLWSVFPFIRYNQTTLESILN